MFGDNKQIRDVADVAARIMAGLPPLQEKLHPNQQKIDVVDDEKIDGKDFAKLRAGKKPDVKKEEVEIEEESHQSKTTMKHIPNPSPAQKQAAKDIKPGVGGYRDRIDMLKSAGVKEEVEEIDEATMTHITLGAKVKDKEGGYNQDVHHKGKKIGHIEAYKHRTGMRYGSHHDASGDSTAGNRDAEESIADIRFAHADHLKSMKKEQVEQMDEVKMADLPSTKVQGRSYGSSKPQPSAFDVLKGPKEKELKSIESEKKKKKMSEMVALYKDGGMKAFFESIKKDDLISEEPDSEQFAKELEDQKKRAAGTKPQADVAKASVQSVKQEEVEQIDELKKSTLGSYVKKASTNLSARSHDHGEDEHRQYGYGDDDEEDKRVDRDEKKIATRQQGIHRAATKLSKEKVEITDEMIFEVLENAGIDFESLSDDELQEVANEAYEILDEISTKTLAKAASAASDPDADYHYGKSHDPQKFADHAKKTKDAKSAAAVQGAADAKGHYTRPGHSLGSYDKLAHRTPARVTGAGKANKQDVNKLKKSISLNAEATEQDIYVIDADLANGVDQVNIEERMMTQPEKEKKEQMVKSMKKGLAGFKERYGDRAKNVMYATATKNAMKD